MREHRGTFNRNQKIQDMFMFDPIASLIVVAGVFIYFACKGASEKKPVKTRTKEEEWADEVKRREMLIQQAKESGKDISKCNGYIAWLYNHRQEKDEE